MTIRTIHGFARALIEAQTLAGKLVPPPRGIAGGSDHRLDDTEPGPAVRISEPGRPAEIALVPARKTRVPPAAGMADPHQRGRILHALANHELQAAELFAWALLAFPDAPAAFRRGLLAILADEQRHCQLYLDCLAEVGVRFGDHPVTGHFWNKIQSVTTPLHFICTMGLTFENANLDFAGDYMRAAERASDPRTVAALAVVHADEIRHVRFAWTWLQKLKPPGQSPWEAYLANIEWPLGPARARGKDLDIDSRIAAGLDDEFIANLADTLPKRPGGAPR